jgi:hypothetical protein
VEQEAGTGTPAEQETGGGTPVEQEGNSEAPVAQEPASGAPAEQDAVQQEAGTGSPAEQEAGSEAPVAQEGGAGSPAEQEAGSEAPVAQEAGSGAPVEQEAGSGAPVEQQAGGGESGGQEIGTGGPVAEDGGAKEPAEQAARNGAPPGRQDGQESAVGGGAGAGEGSGTNTEVNDQPIGAGVLGQAEPGESGPVDADITEADRSGLAGTDVSQKYPSDYTPSSEAPPHVDRPHQSPESWAGDINPEKQADGRDNNCGECARAVQNTWNGEPSVAAAMSDKDAAGEPRQRMSDWAGAEPQPESMSQVEQHLRDLGPGSSAIVGAYWNGGGGHWFNAVNDRGMVKAVDGQSGKVESWPPSDSDESSLGFDESNMRSSMAIYFDGNGRVVK